jgi:hypothetical protein
MGLIGRLTGNVDPLVSTASLIALVVAWNAPFYPLYVWAVAGAGGMPWALATTASLPFFGAVPFVARRFPLAARIMLPLVGTINTAWCSVLLGQAAGEELFLIPCGMIAVLLFRPRERLLMAVVAAAPLAAHLLLAGRYPVPPHVYTVAQYASLTSMNAISVAMLTAFVGFLFAGVLAQSEKTQNRQTGAPAQRG